MSKLIGAKLGETAYLSVTDDGKLQYSLTGEAGDFVEFETSGGGGDIDTSNLTATADDLLEGETAIGADGAEITGTIQTVTLQQNGTTVSIAKGYVAEAGSITVPGEGGGTDISDATATNDMVLEGEVFYGLNGRGTGTIQTVTATLTDNTVTVPKGYIAEAQTLTVAEAAATLSDNIVTVPKGYHQAQTLTVAVAKAPTVSDNVVTIHKGYVTADTDVTIATATASKSGNVVTIPKGFHQAQTLTVGTARQAETIVPGAEDIVIPADTYLAGALTIQAVESGGESSGIKFYECSSIQTGGVRRYFTLSGAPDTDANTAYERTTWVETPNIGANEYITTALWTASNGYTVVEECGQMECRYRIKDATETPIYYNKMSGSSRVSDYNTIMWADWNNDSIVELSFSDIQEEPSQGSWSGYKATWNGTDWVKAEEPTTGLQIAGYTPEEGKVYTADTTALCYLHPDEPTGGETVASMAFYKCTEVDVGMAYDDYQNANVSGVTSPTEINGEFIIKDPMTLDNNRVFTKDGYTLGYDKENTAWCITEADSPNYINSIFYAKIDGLSTEKGTLANPFWWDSEGVATSDRTTTGSYNLNEAPMNEESWMYEGYCFYVKLKAGTAYTIGIVVPPNDDSTWYDPYLYLKDTNNTRLASGTRTDTGMSLTYTPAADGVFIIQAMEEYNSLSTPITCSPAPEQSTNPPVGLFEQTDWRVGAGIDPGFNVVSAGLAECVQRFNLIEGNGFSTDSVWQSEDGTHYVWYYDHYEKWIMGTEVGTGTYKYGSERFEASEGVPHPCTLNWNDRSSSSHGDYPVLEPAPQSGVSGTPTVTPIAMPGRDEVGYAEWSGKLMVQNTETGAWSETETVKNGMKAYNWTPAPGGYYSEDGNAASNLYRGLKGSVYGWGFQSQLTGSGSTETYSPSPYKLFDAHNFKSVHFMYGVYRSYALGTDGCIYAWGASGSGLSEASNVPVKISEQTFSQIAVGRQHLCGVDTDGYLWAIGANSYGQLGDGTTSSKSALTKIGDKKWSFVYCTEYATIALDDSGIMWGAGQGTNYKFGNSSTDNLTTLTKLNDKVWRSVWGSNSRTFAVDADGYLWGAGSSGNGSLGTGSTTTEKTFVQIGNQKWKKVVAGSSHTIAINAEGFLYGWGYNNVGQLGNGEGTGTPYKPVQIDNTKKWIDVTAYEHASGGVDAYGQAFWWGSDSSYLAPFRAFSPQKIHVPGKCFSIVYSRTNNSAFVLTDE